MSYILDALRKAEAERARGAVPGVHAQQGPDDHDGGGSRLSVRLLATAVAVLFAALIGVLGWQWMDRKPDVSMTSADSRPPARDETLAQASTQAPAQAQPQSPSPAPSPAPLQAPLQAPPQIPESALPGSREPGPSHSLPPQGLEQPRALPPRLAADANAPPHAATPLPTVPSVTNPGPRAPRSDMTPGSTVVTPNPSANSRAPEARTGPTPAPLPTQAQTPMQGQGQTQGQAQGQGQVLWPGTPTAPAPTTQSQRIYAMSELPEGVRSSLPSYAVSGSSYSENAAARLLILNGQVAREGDMLPGGAVLEQIKLKSAVLRFKGYRFEMSY